MTILFGKKTDAEPICCSVCGRQAGAMGYVSTRQAIAWSCNGDFCLKHIGSVYHMGSNELNRYEFIAVDRAKKKVLASQFEIVLNALFDQGVRDLNELSSDLFSKAIDSLKDNNDQQQIYEQFLKQYAQEIKDQIVARDPPF